MFFKIKKPEVQRHSVTFIWPEGMTYVSHQLTIPAIGDTVHFTQLGNPATPNNPRHKMAGYNRPLVVVDIIHDYYVSVDHNAGGVKVDTHSIAIKLDDPSVVQNNHNHNTKKLTCQKLLQQPL